MSRPERVRPVTLLPLIYQINDALMIRAWRAAGFTTLGSGSYIGKRTCRCSCNEEFADKPT